MATIDDDEEEMDMMLSFTIDRNPVVQKKENEIIKTNDVIETTSHINTSSWSYNSDINDEQSHYCARMENERMKNDVHVSDERRNNFQLGMKYEKNNFHVSPRNIFHFIPADILSRTFSGYLSINDVSRLDIAICSTSIRGAFLSSIHSNIITFFGSKKAYGDHYILWLNMRNISVTYLQGNRMYITEKSIKSLKYDNDGTHCLSKLYHLDLQNCIKIKENSILTIIGNCSKLVKLNLSACRITDNILLKISCFIPCLLSLNLMGNDKLSDSSVMEIAEKCPLINTLNLSYCNKISANGFISVCKLLDLKGLQVMGCLNMTDVTLLGISKECKNIVNLDLDECICSMTSLITATRDMCLIESIDMPVLHRFATIDLFSSILSNLPHLSRLGIRNVIFVPNFEDIIYMLYPNVCVDRHSSRSKSTKSQ